MPHMGGSVSRQPREGEKESQRTRLVYVLCFILGIVCGVPFGGFLKGKPLFHKVKADVTIDGVLDAGARAWQSPEGSLIVKFGKLDSDKYYYVPYGSLRLYYLLNDQVGETPMGLVCYFLPLEYHKIGDPKTPWPGTGTTLGVTGGFEFETVGHNKVEVTVQE